MCTGVASGDSAGTGAASGALIITGAASGDPTGKGCSSGDLVSTGALGIWQAQLLGIWYVQGMPLGTRRAQVLPLGTQ